MLRTLVVILLLANGLFYAWTQDLLPGGGPAGASQREPQRLARQLHPEALRLVSPDAVRSPDTQAGTCLQAGLFDPAQAATLRSALAPSLPEGSWVLDIGTEPGRWIIYMGRYANAEAVARKRAELRALNVRTEPLPNPALEPGLSLGTFTTEAAARDALAQLANRRVRTARVLQDRPETRGFWLRLPHVDDTLRQRLDTLRPALLGKPLRPCR